MLPRFIISSGLLLLAGCLCWYGVLANRMAVKDVAFLRGHSSAKLFSEVWLLEGNLAYYGDMDASRAAQYYRESIRRQPLMTNAWIGLAKAEIMLGNEEGARSILKTLAPVISHVSTWKWDELLLGYDLRDERYFADSFNFILQRLPARVSEASYLAVSYWGGWEAVLPHLAPESRVVFLRELMKAKQVDAALALWKGMDEGAGGGDKALQLRFCQFLLDNGRVSDAKGVWKNWTGNDRLGVYDGSFEQEPVNQGFGWRFGKQDAVTIERTRELPFKGNYCLHVRFRGTQNITFNQVSQIVPVDPGREYRLRFAQKSRSLTTDQGVFVALSGYRCQGLSLQSRPVKGTIPWTREELQFRVPEACEAVLLQVRRKESLMFDNKISGDYWLDDVEVE